MITAAVSYLIMKGIVYFLKVEFDPEQIIPCNVRKCLDIPLSLIGRRGDRRTYLTF
jgi:hypothetical protein